MKHRFYLDSACLKIPETSFDLTILLDLNFSEIFGFQFWVIFPCFKRGQLPTSRHGNSHNCHWINSIIRFQKINKIDALSIAFTTVTYDIVVDVTSRLSTKKLYRKIFLTLCCYVIALLSCKTCIYDPLIDCTFDKNHTSVRPEPCDKEPSCYITPELDIWIFYLSVWICQHWAPFLLLVSKLSSNHVSSYQYHRLNIQNRN